MISRETLQRLEFDRLLAEVARHAHSDVSRGQILSIAPLTDRAEIDRQSGMVAEIRALNRLGISLSLSAFDDVRPQLELLRPAGAFLGPFELLSFLPVLRIFAAIARQCAPRSDIPLLKSLTPQLRSFPEILEPLEASIDSDGSILDSASVFLRETRRAKRALAGRIRRKIEEIIRSSGIEMFLQDDFITQRSGRWVIPVRMDSKGMVKGVVHDVSSSGETAFMEPLEIIPFVNELENLSADEKAEEIRILRQISGWIREDSAEIAACFGTLLTLDRLNSVACFGDEFALEPAAFNRQGELRLVSARHPLLLMLQQRGALQRVEPLDLVLGTGDGQQGGASVMVITGPNAGGKTIALKTAGMLCLMALSALPVPAAPRSTFPLLDALLVDIGDEQSIEQSHSTFSAHAARIADILAQAGGNSLVLLDELGAGTEPLQGGAIACGVLHELHRQGAMVIATTHLTEIIGFVHRSPGMANAGMEFDERNFMPLYRLVVGEPGQSHAIEIARRFGMPDGVIGFARRMLGDAGSEFASLLGELRQRRVELEEQRHGLALRDQQLQQRSLELEARAVEVAQLRREAAEKAWGDARDLIAQSRRRMNELLAGLKRENRSEVLEQLHQAEQILVEKIKPAGRDEGYVAVTAARPGDAVRVRTLGCSGEVLSVDERSGKVRVRAGRMEIEVPLADLLKPAGTAGGGRKAGRSVSVRSVVEESDQQELKLIGLRVDEALALLEPFVNHAVASGRREVRVIHGVGSGRLRDAVREELGRNPLVEEFRPGTQYEGRDGATVVTLRV